MQLSVHHMLWLLN